MALGETWCPFCHLIRLYFETVLGAASYKIGWFLNFLLRCQWFVQSTCCQCYEFRSRELKWPAEPRADVHTESNQLIVYGGPALWLEADFIQGAGPLAPQLAQCEIMKWNRNRAKIIDYLVLLSRPNFPSQQSYPANFKWSTQPKSQDPTTYIHLASITTNSIEKWTVILYTCNTWELRVKNLKGF